MRNASVGVFTAYNGIPVDQFNSIFAEAGIAAGDYYDRSHGHAHRVGRDT